MSQPPVNAARRELAVLKAQAAGAAPLPLPATPSLDLAVQRPRVGVGCLLTCAARPGALLVGQRRGSHGAGSWALPGGHLEFGASFADAASAELGEECGVRLPPARWAHVFTSNNVMASEDLHYITLFQHAELTAEEAGGVRNEEPHKCEGWAWLTLAELRGLPLFLPLAHLLEAPVLATLLPPQV
jgi:8-oxo-dGTP diphosphatase